MPTTDLQAEFHGFARGKPALGFSIDYLERAILQYGGSLAGTYPSAPHPVMANARLPVYGLAYSGFVRTLTLDLSGPRPELTVALTATVHPFGNPAQVIAYYEITMPAPLEVYLDYLESSRELRWACRTTPFADVAPNFTVDAEMILRACGVPEPVLETYEDRVEDIIVWNTANTFVQLVLDALPSIDIGEMAPWLFLRGPLESRIGPRYVLVASENAHMSIGTCSPVDVVVEPDTEFPYQKPDPVADRASHAAIAVYLPKTRLVQFVATSVMPAIMFDSRERGGVIRWRVNGAFGLKKFTLDISGGIEVGIPGPSDITLRGMLAVSTDVALTGVARAWINGPCGKRIGLASASVQGDGSFAADLLVAYRPAGGPGTPPYGATVDAALAVTRSELDPNIDIDAVGWPIDDVIGVIADHLVSNEVHKLAGAVHRLGSWNVMAIPSWFVELLGGGESISPVVESTEGLSTIIGITTNPG